MSVAAVVSVAVTFTSIEPMTPVPGPVLKNEPTSEPGAEEKINQSGKSPPSANRAVKVVGSVPAGTLSMSETETVCTSPWKCSAGVTSPIGAMIGAVKSARCSKHSNIACHGERRTIRRILRRIQSFIAGTPCRAGRGGRDISGSGANRNLMLRPLLPERSRTKSQTEGTRPKNRQLPGINTMAAVTDGSALRSFSLCQRATLRRRHNRHDRGGCVSHPSIRSFNANANGVGATWHHNLRLHARRWRCG